LIEIGSKTAEKNSAQTNRQTDRQTDRHYENNGHLVLNQYFTGPHVPYLLTTPYSAAIDNVEDLCFVSWDGSVGSMCSCCRPTVIYFVSLSLYFLSYLLCYVFRLLFCITRS